MKLKHAVMRPLVLALGAWPALGIAQDTQLGEVRVISTTIDDRFAGKRGEPSSTHDISGKTVDEKRPENMIEMLRSIPGVTADLSSGDEIKIKLRGIENQRYMGEKPGVAIVIDGVPVFERTGKVNIDLDNIESIKVIKGGASYLFGEDALSGAVIITTKRGAKYKGVTLSADAGSWAYNRQLARAGFGADWGSGHIQASHRAGDDYYFQSAYRTDYIDGNLRFLLTDTSDLTFNFEQSRRKKDKHGAVKGAEQAAIDPIARLGRDYSRKYDVDLDKLNLTYSNDYTQNGNILFTAYEYRDRTNFWSSPQTLTANGVLITSATPGYYEAYQTLNRYDQVQRGGKAEWRSAAGSLGWLGGLDVRRNSYKNYNTAGVTYCSRTNASPGPACTWTTTTMVKGKPVKTVTNMTVTRGTVLTDDTTDEATNAAYGELKWQVAPQWVLTANARHDALDIDYRARPGSDNGGKIIDKSKSYGVNSWRLGVNHAANRSLDFFGNLSTGFRTPSVDQLYRGSISPSSGKTASNEDLVPERSLNLELGMRSRSEWLGVATDVEAAVFQIDRNNFILATTGQYGGSNSTTDIERYENIGGVRNRGFELAVKSDKKRTFAIDAAYTWLDATFTRYDRYNLILGMQYGSPYPTPGLCPATAAFPPDKCYKLVARDNTGNQVPRVPRHTLNLTGYWNATERLGFSLEMDGKTWSYADEINQEKLPGRALFNLAATWDIKEGGFMGAKWSLLARINNLFDRGYWVTSRGSNDQKSNLTDKYDGIYNNEDTSIIVGKPRSWLLGLTASF